MPSGGGVQPISLNVSDYKLRLTEWNPNAGFPVKLSGVRDNMYMLYWPFDSPGDQLDSEIVPLRVQWASDEGKSELDPHSESWQRYKTLYNYQFGEQKTVGLYAPDLSYAGQNSHGKDEYSFGHYLRLVRLYVKPEFRTEFEGFVHSYIVPAADKIFAEKNRRKNLAPLAERARWKYSPYTRLVSINVNMATIPDFELFVQKTLVPAAHETDTPMLGYRTVTGDRHNYTFVFPFDGKNEIHNDRHSLIASRLLREHQTQLVAKRRGTDARYETAALSNRAEAEAVKIADNLSAEFHSHAIDIEEIVLKSRPDMSSLLRERFTDESLEHSRTLLKA